MYGGKVQKERIYKEIRQHKNNVTINETIRVEIGRTVFKSFFLVKEKIFTAIKQVKIGELVIDDFWKLLRQGVSKSYRKKQTFQRINMIIDNIYDRLRLTAGIEFNELTENEKVLAELDIYECAIFQIEHELFEFELNMNQYNYIETYYCHQSNWKMVYLNPEYGYTLIFDGSCDKSKCPNRLEILRNILNTNHSLILSYLQNVNAICNAYNINPDKRLVKSLNDILEYFNRKKNPTKKLYFRSKPCWNLADFSICLLVNSHSYVFTVDYNHFFPLLAVRGKEKQLIKFNP